MRISSVDRRGEPKFKAAVHFDKPLILRTLLQDKKLTLKDYAVVSDLLDDLDKFTKMPEGSIVEIFPRADKGQVNLICNVFDRTKKFFHPVWERSVRKLSQEDNFRARYLKNTENLIKNVDITRTEIDRLTETISSSKNIKGIIDKYGDIQTNPEKIKEFFEASPIRGRFLDSLEKNYNPGDRLNSIFKMIDSKSTGKEIYISTQNVRLPKELASLKGDSRNTCLVVSIKDEKGEVQKRALLSGLFSEPIENKLI